MCSSLRLRVPIINMVTISKFIEHAIVLSPVEESSLTRAKSSGVRRRIKIFLHFAPSAWRCPLKGQRTQSTNLTRGVRAVESLCGADDLNLKVSLLQEIHF